MSSRGPFVVFICAIFVVGFMFLQWETGLMSGKKKEADQQQNTMLFARIEHMLKEEHEALSHTSEDRSKELRSGLDRLESLLDKLELHHRLTQESDTLKLQEQNLKLKLEVDGLNKELEKQKTSQNPLTKYPSAEHEWISQKLTCYNFSDFSQMCLYHNLCFDGVSLIFLESGSKNESTLTDIRLTPEQVTRYDSRYFEPHPYPPIGCSHTPSGSSFVFPIKRASIPPHLIENAKNLIDVAIASGLVKNAELIDGTTWFPGYDGSPGNIWHIVAQNMLLWDARLWNETLGGFPPIDNLVTKRDFVIPGWQYEILELILQPQTKLYWNPWIFDAAGFKEQDISPGFYQAFRDRGDAQTVGKHRSRIQVRPPGKPGLGSENWMCMKDVVVFSQKPRIFSGIYSAERFKQAVAGYLGMKLPPARAKYENWIDRNTYRVVVMNRSGGRSIVNIDAVVELLEYYQLEVIVKSTPGEGETLRVQTEGLWDADVLIGVHGAALTNAMFLPYRAGLIEIFPWGFRPPMYGNLANAMGLYYQSVQSWVKPDPEKYSCAESIYEAPYVDRCRNSSNMEMVENGCGPNGKRACVEVDIRALEQSLLNVYDYLSENLNARVESLFVDSPKYQQQGANDWHNPRNFVKS